MKRIAYCSPINPQSSGIADYSEELLPYLGRYAKVVLFVARGVEPSNPHLRRHLEVQPLDRLQRLHATRPFDAILYHIGNSPLHAEIYELAQRLPGVVVLHDFVLHHFRLWHAAARQGDVEAYLAEMAHRYGERGAAVGRRMARGLLLDVAFEMPLVEEVIVRAAGVLGHSRLVVERVRALRPDVPVERVPMGVPLPPLLPASVARERLGLPRDVPIWASFGHINPYKRMEPALRAFRRFRAHEPEARYLLVGSVSPAYDLPALIRRLELTTAVEVTGYVSSEKFRHYVAASDLCLNLRYPTAGETSASVLRLLGAGRPTLVSAIDALDELPDDVCAKVDLGPAEGDQILAYARLLHLLPAAAEALGRNARDFVAQAHTLEGAARGYMHFLARLYSWDAPVPQRSALWEVGGQGPGVGGRGTTTPDPDEPPGYLEPSTMREAPGAVGDLARDAGAALAELGIQPHDGAVLQDVATTIADLLGPETQAPRPKRKP